MQQDESSMESASVSRQGKGYEPWYANVQALNSNILLVK